MSDYREPPQDPPRSSVSGAPTVLPNTTHRGRRKASSIVLPVLFALALVLVGFTGMWAWMRWGTGSNPPPVAVTTRSSTPSPTPPTTSASPTPTPSGSATHTASLTPTPTPTHRHHASASPTADRSAPVVVFNQTGVSGLAATFAGRLTQKGWHVTAVDNWVGTVPSSTVYYRPGGAAAARTLRHDFPVIGRVRPAVSGMPTAGLTVILAGNVHL